MKSQRVISDLLNADDGRNARTNQDRHNYVVDRGSSVVERSTLNRGNLVSNPLGHRFEIGGFSSTPHSPRSVICIHYYLAVDGDGNT